MKKEPSQVARQNFDQIALALLRQTIGDPIQQRAHGLMRDIDTTHAERRLYGEGVLRINPYEKDVLTLIENEQRARRFRKELSDYEQHWSQFPYKSAGKTHRDRVFSILNRHPHVQRARDVFAVPLAVMMDIANQSDVGIYTQEKPAVLPVENLDTAFTTLAHHEYWRRMMRRHAGLMAR